MRSERTVLRIGRADGEVREVPMRYNASHQRGWRCFIGYLADAPDEITEEEVLALRERLHALAREIEDEEAADAHVRELLPVR